MKSRALVTVLMLAALLTVAAELFADIVVLKSGHRIQGQIIGEDAEAVVIQYRDGWLKIPKRNTDRIVKVRELSEYGRQGFVPSEGELQRIEEAAIKTSGAGATSAKGLERTLNPGELVTTRHTLKAGKQSFTFELPLSWTAGKAGDTTVYSLPGEEPRPCATASIIKTSGIRADEQTELAGAVMKTELGGFKLVYACLRTGDSDGEASCMVSGTYGAQNNEIIAKTVLHKTPEHTLAITFFIPVRLYDRYKQLPGACADSLEVKESGR